MQSAEELKQGAQDIIAECQMNAYVVDSTVTLKSCYVRRERWEKIKRIIWNVTVMKKLKIVDTIVIAWIVEQDDHESVDPSS